jgi:hypothetical protein
LGEIPTITSRLTWEQVSLPPSVSETDIDRIIFAELKQVARKVALVVGNAAVRSEQELGVSVGSEIFAARLRELADDGRINFYGDLRKWRFSEVSLRT